MNRRLAEYVVLWGGLAATLLLVGCTARDLPSPTKPAIATPTILTTLELARKEASGRIGWMLPSKLASMPLDSGVASDLQSIGALRTLARVSGIRLQTFGDRSVFVPTTMAEQRELVISSGLSNSRWAELAGSVPASWARQGTIPILLETFLTLYHFGWTGAIHRSDIPSETWEVCFPDIALGEVLALLAEANGQRAVVSTTSVRLLSNGQESAVTDP